MRYIMEDKKYNFKTAFDTVTGMYVRTGVLDADGNDTGVYNNEFLLHFKTSLNDSSSVVNIYNPYFHIATDSFTAK